MSERGREGGREGVWEGWGGGKGGGLEEGTECGGRSTFYLLPPLRYNPAHDSESRLLRHRAVALQDMAHSILQHELNEDFEQV